MSIKFKSISIQNFLSFGKQPTTINLDSSNNTLIVGENRDVGSEGYSKNGVGKSTIFQALTWVIYNEGISSIKQDAFVNIINKKNMVVELELEVNGIEYVIRRGRKPAVCEVLKNGEPYTNHSISSVDDTIEDLIGINYDTFCNTIMLNTTTVPFMNLKPAGQRNFMEKMVGLDILSQRADTIKSKNKDLAIEIRLEEQNQEHALRALEKAKDHVEYLVSKEIKWKMDNKSAIQETKDNIEMLSGIDTVAIMKLNKERLKHLDNISVIKTKIKDINGKLDQKVNLTKANLKSVIQELSSKFYKDKSKLEDTKAANIRGFGSEKDKLNKELIEINNLINEIKKTISDTLRTIDSNTSKINKLEEEKESLESGTCPYCHQSHVDGDRIEQIVKLIVNLESDNNERTDMTDQLKAELPKYQDEMNVLQQTIKDNDNALSKVENTHDLRIKKIKGTLDKDIAEEQKQNNNEVDRIRNRSKEEIIQLNKQLDSLVDNMPTSEYSDEDCHEVVNNIKHLVEELKKLKAEVNPYTEQVEKAKSEIEEYDESKLIEMRKKENHYKLLVKLLTDNKSFVRKNLLDQYVPFINTKIEDYLDKLELPHRITINNDLSVDIMYMMNSVSYGNMSNGERGRTNFAVSMAFNDLMSVSGHQFNFLGVDELFDGQGMDSAGMYAVWNILKNKSDSIFVITHREELLSEADQIMTIVKENGFSKVMTDV